jgi:serine/threonine-protein kinase
MDHTRIDPVTVPRGPTDARTDLRSIGAYRILRRLGEGGMGAVYLGYNESEGRQVAIKVLSDQLAGNQGFIDRFYREAKSGALLNHPNIVRSITAGQDAATKMHYLVLEYVDGTNAQALLNQLGRLPVGDAVTIVLDVARGLEHAHSRNLIHRDIKPDNILITRSGVAKLTDLGLAKRIDEPSHLTGARQSFGTTPYMPYEQALTAKNADGRSDIYALGATLYHLVTGVVPFPGDNHVEVVEQKERGDYPAASSINPAVPAALDAVLARMLARQRRDRYQTVSELIVDLQRSRLAAAVPSFADPEQARQDPWAQARQSDDALPTRLDPESPVRRGDDAWVLRYRNRSGKLRKAKATTAQIVERLRDGRLPTPIQVRRLEAPEFHSPSHFPEFRAVAHLLRSRRKTRRGDSSVDAVSPTATAARQTLGGRQTLALALLATAGLAALVGVAAWLSRWF